MKKKLTERKIPEANPLWDTDNLRYEAALEAHNNLEAIVESTQTHLPNDTVF